MQPNPKRSLLTVTKNNLKSLLLNIFHLFKNKTYNLPEPEEIRDKRHCVTYAVSVCDVMRCITNCWDVKHRRIPHSHGDVESATRPEKSRLSIRCRHITDKNASHRDTPARHTQRVKARESISLYGEDHN